MAWIQISGIGVDYPVVQGKDDEHYLHYIFGGKVNKAGSIFLDYRNLADLLVRRRVMPMLKEILLPGTKMGRGA